MSIIRFKLNYVKKPRKQYECGDCGRIIEPKEAHAVSFEYDTLNPGSIYKRLCAKCVHIPAEQPANITAKPRLIKKCR
jgi:hypothetical protein